MGGEAKPAPDLAWKAEATKLDLPRPDLARADLPRPDLFPKPDAKPDVYSKPDAKKPDGPGFVVPGTWVTVAKGSFAMGSPQGEPCRAPAESQHQVTLTRAFAISATEVTQAQFQQVMGYQPSSFTTCGSTCPVEKLSWHEAAAYCNTLSQKVGVAACYACSGQGAAVTCTDAAAYAGGAIYACPGYRLPTEAEWEYAYRAGTTTALYSGAITSNCNGTDPNADAIAWYGVTSPSPVKQKQANAWGLHDMAGNVSEWVHDYSVNNLGSAAVTDPWGATSGTRVYRGGSYFYGLKYLRAAYRDSWTPTGTSTDIGFRCARSK